MADLNSIFFNENFIYLFINFWSGHFIALNLVGHGVQVHHFSKSHNGDQRLADLIVLMVGNWLTIFMTCEGQFHDNS